MSRFALAVLTAGLALAGCGDAGGAAGGTPAAGEPRTLTVLAASSLREAFGRLETSFETGNPGTDVRISFGASSDLASQIQNGAPADVFASANQDTMKKVAEAGLVAGQPRLFASNTLTIVTPPGNPKAVRSFADLARPGTTVVVCAPQVPCGAATAQVEQSTAVTLAPVSEEPDVKSVLSKVQAGEADAGLVYVTDARSAGAGVEEVAFPEAAEAVNEYPIAALREAPQPDLATAWVDLVVGPEGRHALQAAGFGGPAP